jgi:hypothetical protein
MLQTAIKLSVPKRCRVRRIDLRAHQGGLVRLFSLFWCASKWIKEIRHQSISAQLLEHPKRVLDDSQCPPSLVSREFLASGWAPSDRATPRVGNCCR